MPCRNLPVGSYWAPLNDSTRGRLIRQSSFEGVLLLPAGSSHFGHWASITCRIGCTQIDAGHLYAQLELLAAFGDLLNYSDCMNAAAVLGEPGLARVAKYLKLSVAEGL